MRKAILFLALFPVLLIKSQPAHSFCGFYVAKVDTKIFNKASQVVLVRQDDKTVIIMVNDFKGDPKEFAVVIPVPILIEKGQIHIGDKKIVDHLDAYTSPRLVEYYDGSPCRLRVLREGRASGASRAQASLDSIRARRTGSGSTLRAQ